MVALLVRLTFAGDSQHWRPSSPSSAWALAPGRGRRAQRSDERHRQPPEQRDRHAGLADRASTSRRPSSLCSTRTANTSGDQASSRAISTSAGGRRGSLTITPSFAPGNTTTRVQYYVAEFAAGVSVQRGIATLQRHEPHADRRAHADGGRLHQELRADLGAQRPTRSAARDEIWTVRATLGTGAAPCTSGTTTSLELTRDDGRAERRSPWPGRW